MDSRKLHIELAETRRSPDGKLAFELGLKFGYWPCLKAPFVAIALGYRRLDIWHGLPSKWPNRKPPENDELLAYARRRVPILRQRCAKNIETIRKANRKET